MKPPLVSLTINRKRLILVMLLLVIMAAFSVGKNLFLNSFAKPCPHPGKANTYTERVIQLGQTPFQVQVAETPAQQLHGLMFRTQLAERNGMLFPFARREAVTFWMKNCKIPLDMIFIAQGKVVHVVHSAPPCLQDPCPVYSSEYPTDTVVELFGGSAQRYAITPGTAVQLLPEPADKPQPNKVPTP